MEVRGRKFNGRERFFLFSYIAYLRLLRCVLFVLSFIPSFIPSYPLSFLFLFSHSHTFLLF